MKIKKFFNTPLKASLSIVSLIAIITIFSTGTVYTASAIAQNSSIGEENAKNFSFADAGIDPTTAKDVQTEFDYEQGQFVYEIEFTADGSEYEYWINASDGTVVKKNIEIVTLSDTNKTESAQISLDKAKEIALSDAKLTGSSVTFTTAKLDKEDHILVYELEFYSGKVEYEYEINANTGAIYSKSKEAQKEQKPAAIEKPNSADGKDNTDKPVTNKQPTANRITLDAAKAKALADANLSSSSVTFTEGKLEYDDGIAVYDIEFHTSTHEYEYEINAVTGAVHDKENTEKKDNSNTYIGIDKAKTIAANHAGLSISSVTFSKAKLDKDDGNTVYEVEFYKDGIEYEYEIDASSGKVLEYDKERAD